MREQREPICNQRSAMAPTLNPARLRLRRYACALVAWSALMLVNLPWAVLLLLPCMLACKCELAFIIIAHMSGIHRRPDAAHVDRVNHV